MKTLILDIDPVTGCYNHRQKGPYANGGGWRKHRRIFLETHGYLPEVVMHTCDNPRCLNPLHLAPGTWATNNKDRSLKNRSAKRVPSRRKITDEQALEIRQFWANRSMKKGGGVAYIASLYGVDPVTVYNIVKWRTHFA